MTHLNTQDVEASIKHNINLYFDNDIKILRNTVYDIVGRIRRTNNLLAILEKDKEDIYTKTNINLLRYVLIEMIVISLHNFACAKFMRQSKRKRRQIIRRKIKDFEKYYGPIFDNYFEQKLREHQRAYTIYIEAVRARNSRIRSIDDVSRNKK